MKPINVCNREEYIMIIGLMGGVGSGKSTVLNYLRDQYNAEIIQSDMVAKEVMKPGFEEIGRASCRERVSSPV